MSIIISSDGEISSLDSYDMPAELTVYEKKAVFHIYNAFTESGIDFDDMRFRRRSCSYLTMLAPNGNDFCRIMASERTAWFSVDVWRLSDKIKSDSRFDDVKKRTIRHWKVKLNCIDDFKDNSDLIVESYKSIISLPGIQSAPPLRETKELHFLRKFINEDAANGQQPCKGKSIRKNISDYAVIDLETTGLNTKFCEIIELAAVRIRDGQIIDTFETLIKPESEIPYVVTKKTNITNEMVETAPKINEKFQEYLDFIGDDIVLGHNIDSYDIHIIHRYCEELNLRSFNNDTLDTLKFSRKCDIDIPDHKLTTLANYFGIEHENAHRALDDCIANFKCYEKLKEFYRESCNCSKTLNKKNGNELSGKKNNSIIEEPNVEVCGKQICLTGDFDCGSKGEITAKLESLGAIVQKTVSGKTNYLIVGKHGSDKWSYGNYGSKVKKALDLQSQGKDIKIIKEEEFFKCSKVTA